MVALNDTAELAVIGSRLGQQVIVTHHFRHITGPGPQTLQNLIDSWQAVAQVPWLAYQRPDYTLVKLRARHVCGSLPLDATTEETVNLAGTSNVSANPLAPWLAVVVRARTAAAGRSRRGRFFVPLTAEEDVAGEAIVAGTQTLIQAYVTALQNAFIGVGATNTDWALVVHSRKLAGIPGTQCQNSSTIVTSLALQTALTSQRSRRTRPA